MENIMVWLRDKDKVLKKPSKATNVEELERELKSMKVRRNIPLSRVEFVCVFPGRDWRLSRAVITTSGFLVKAPAFRVHFGYNLHVVAGVVVLNKYMLF
jgi:hypothetical protein